MQRRDAAVDTLRERFGSDGPVTVASAPGRVNLVGGHTDYNDGFVLPAAIDHRTVVAAAPRTDDTLRVYSRDFDEHAALCLEGKNLEAAGWPAYVAGVAAAVRDAGHDLGGADLVADGGVPMGAGLSSSAALEVAVAGALAAVAGTDLAPETLADLCWRAETEFVGVDCGIMDQFAVALAERDAALFLDCRTRETEPVPLDGAGVVVTDTTVQHDLVDSAYNDRVRECAAGVDALDAAMDAEVTALRDVSVGAFEAHANVLDPAIRRRCRHVVTENARVERAVEALRRGDLPEVGRLLQRSHESLRDDYAVSCAELDTVVERAATHEAVYGSRLTGAGFGGSVVSLVERDAAADVAAWLAEACGAALDVNPETYVCRPAGGLRVDGESG
jgi:galactokinase